MKDSKRRKARACVALLAVLVAGVVVSMRPGLLRCPQLVLVGMCAVVLVLTLVGRIDGAGTLEWGSVLGMILAVISGLDTGVDAVLTVRAPWRIVGASWLALGLLSGGLRREVAAK